MLSSPFGRMSERRLTLSLTCLCTTTPIETMLRHDQPPQASDGIPPDLQAKMDKLLSSDYAEYVGKLKPLVEGKTVIGSEAGNSGFVLLFDDDSWVAVYLLDERMRWAAGSGPPDERTTQLIRSPACGDGRTPLQQDLPFADQYCDVEQELSKAHDKPVTGLAIGEGDFNFCFPEGRELDVMLVKDAAGKPAFRVFWEQW